MNTPSVLNPGSPQAADILHLFWIVLVLAAIVFAVVAGLVALNVIRFRRRPGDGPPAQNPGDARLEVVWTVVPLLIVTFLFGLSVRVMHAVQPPPGNEQADLEVTAHQWWWEGHYPKTGVVTANEFHLPVGKKLLLRFRSGDVVHDWWVPELGRKVDIFPHHRTHLWTTIEKPGTYLGTCDEFCGAEHAWMRIRVIADTPGDYDAWTTDQLTPPSPPTDPAAMDGLALYATHTCASCHTIKGLSSGTVGPDLTHVGSRETLASGALDNTLENLTRWIHNAQAIKPDCNMPDMGLSMDESGKIAAYLEGLK